MSWVDSSVAVLILNPLQPLQIHTPEVRMQSRVSPLGSIGIEPPKFFFGGGGLSCASLPWMPMALAPRSSCPPL